MTDIDDQPLTWVTFFAEEGGRLLIVKEASDDVRIAAGIAWAAAMSRRVHHENGVVSMLPMGSRRYPVAAGNASRIGRIGMSLSAGCTPHVGAGFVLTVGRRRALGEPVQPVEPHHPLLCRHRSTRLRHT
ncbi:hypothetical protein [Azospirillum palustre]|uniref:hypothetical protein n=1 Tax=Azospirillum palustre TaxID=2044885 RepID=UPI001177EAE2|nr:hypothetical protein [Azospirillum palustre]